MSSSRTIDQSLSLLESAALAAHNPRDPGDSSGADSQVQVHRGMLVQTSEGHTAGHVAAVVLAQDQQEVTHVLLVQERQLLEYRLIPVEAIEQVSDEQLSLRLLQPDVDGLPTWHGA